MSQVPNAARRLAAGARPTGLRLASCAIALACAAWAGAARATEGGANIYLLGSGGPGAAMLPPLQGVFFDNTAYFYQASAQGGRQFVLGGNLVSGLNVSLPADFATVLWVPSTHFLGGTLAVGAAAPVGYPTVHVNAIITGPRGRRFGVAVSDSTFRVGDPLLSGALSWKAGSRTWFQLSSFVNIPAGEYREGALANVAFHRWAGDVSFAASWHDEKSGWDLSGKAGVTFNGTNESNDYTTGTESHYEVSLEKTFSPAWSAGLQAYYFYQLTGDSGPGAVLGSFSGRVAGVGGTVGWNVKAGKIPLTVRVRGFHEFDAKNRPAGDSLWLDVSLPLHVRMPPSAP